MNIIFNFCIIVPINTLILTLWTRVLCQLQKKRMVLKQQKMYIQISETEQYDWLQHKVTVTETCRTGWYGVILTEHSRSVHKHKNVSESFKILQFHIFVLPPPTKHNQLFNFYRVRKPKTISVIFSAQWIMENTSFPVYMGPTH